MRRSIYLSATLGVVLLVGVLSSNLFSHCQIPCGVYNDDARFEAMLEDVVTLDKSVKAIEHLSKESPPDYNQIVRWVDNKETHADKISETIFKYFLAQRIKEGQKNYEAQLVAAHRVIVLSMKVKQTVDLKLVDQLGEAIRDFQKVYEQREK
ncbi:MAG: superoxide dismutase [Ni] [Planctomycetia bacterium]|jgi:nickel superoxide dismutase